MPKIQTGINIGKHSIEVVQLSKKNIGGFQLINHGKIDLPNNTEGNLSGGTISNYLRRVLEENHIEPINVVSAIADTDVILRYFTIPLLPLKERDSAIRFEAQKYIPFRMEEVISSFFVFPDKEKKKELKVVFVATKKDVLNTHLTLLKEAYIEPSAVETSSFALMRVLRALDLLSKRNLSAIVYVDRTEAVITICDQQIPYLMRDFLLVTQSKDIEIGELGRNELEKSTRYDNLLREIQLSFDYHYKHLPGLVIEKLILVGEESFENWREDLAKELKIPVIIAEPAIIFGKRSELSPRFSTSIGLALRGFLPHDMKINFHEEKVVSPVVKKPSVEEKSFLKRIFLWELVLGLVIIFLLFIALSRQARIVKNNIEQARKTRERWDRTLVSLDKKELEKVYQEWNKKKNVFSRLLDKRIYLTPYLSELPRLLPSGVWLEALRFDSKIDEKGNKFMRLIIEGNVFTGNQNKSDSDLVNELVNNIKNSPLISAGFNKVELGFIEKSKIDKFNITRFKITCTN